MIDQSAHFISRKYAAAFLGVFGDQLTVADMPKLDRLNSFLRKNHALVYLLGLPIIAYQKKKAFLLKIIKNYDLAVLERLIDLLLEQKRLLLLAQIVRMIGKLYRKKNRIVQFRIASYPRVSPDDLKDLVEYLADGTGCAIIYTDYEDKNLIAGIRMESTTYLWEYSIAQQMRALRSRTMR